jgi:hypothetical protein
VALLEKHRTVIYAHFVEQVGEEAAEAMLAQFPSRDLDEPATKDFVAAQIAAVRADMAELRAELTDRIDAQTDRLMTRIQIFIGAGFGFLGVVLVLTR